MITFLYSYTQNKRFPFQSAGKDINQAKNMLCDKDYDSDKDHEKQKKARHG